MFYIAVVILAIIYIIYKAEQRWIGKLKEELVEAQNLANDNAKIADQHRILMDAFNEEFSISGKRRVVMARIIAVQDYFELAMSNMLYEESNKRHQAIKLLNSLHNITPELKWLQLESFLEDICVQAGTSTQKIHTDPKAKSAVIHLLETTPIYALLSNCRTMKRWFIELEKISAESDQLSEDISDKKEALGL